MKKYLLFLLATIAFVACSPNDDDATRPNSGNNCIYYTATEKLESGIYPWTYERFGAQIVSHEWDAESGVGVIKFDKSITKIGRGAFCLCRQLTSITIPDSVTIIEEDAFGLCLNLESVEIGKNVKTIEKRAFQFCEKLTNVTIPDSVTTIEESPFNACSSLTKFDSKFATEDGRCLIIDGVLTSFAPAGLTSYSIPDGVTTIGAYTFNCLDNIISITIPNSVTTIGAEAFSYCDNIAEISIPDSVTTIDEYAFAFCTSLTSVTIPDSVTKIGTGSYVGCSNLEKINSKYSSEDGRCLIINGVLNSFAPAGITSYTIPDGVTMVGYNAVAFITNLEEVIVGDSVTAIEDYAFTECTNLTSATIGENVTVVGDSAFYYCPNLSSVYCKATTPPVGGYDMFEENAPGRKIYVPTESVEAYKTAKLWSEYALNIVGYDF